jgi:hypothetical protein
VILWDDSTLIFLINRSPQKHRWDEFPRQSQKRQTEERQSYCCTGEEDFRVQFLRPETTRSDRYMF